MESRATPDWEGGDGQGRRDFPSSGELSPRSPLLRPADQPPDKGKDVSGLQQTDICKVSHLSLASCVIHLSQSIGKHQTKKSRDFRMPQSPGHSSSLGTLGLLGPRIAHALSTCLPSSSPLHRPEFPMAKSRAGLWAFPLRRSLAWDHPDHRL